MKAQANSPWLDQNGKLLSNEKIKSISKEWSAETWEEFLKSTVEVEAPEIEVTTPDYEGLLEVQEETIWGPPCGLPEAVQKEILSSVRKLDERPKKVIRLQFWENKSVREIAEIESLAHSRIHKIKTVSLCRIKGLLENSVNTSSYLIGGSEKNDLPASREEAIKKVYRMDLEGSYLK